MQPKIYNTRVNTKINPKGIRIDDVLIEDISKEELLKIQLEIAKAIKADEDEVSEIGIQRYYAVQNYNLLLDTFKAQTKVLQEDLKEMKKVKNIIDKILPETRNVVPQTDVKKNFFDILSKAAQPIK